MHSVLIPTSPQHNSLAIPSPPAMPVEYTLPWPSWPTGAPYCCKGGGEGRRGGVEGRVEKERREGKEWVKEWRVIGRPTRFGFIYRDYNPSGISDSR